MTDQPNQSEPIDYAARSAALEQELAETRSSGEARLLRAELKAEAVRAGIIDLDGLKLLDTSALKLMPDGSLPNAAEVLAQFKRDKPWMFAKPNSSNPGLAPAAEQPKVRVAKDMSHTEWQAARERLIRAR